MKIEFLELFFFTQYTSYRQREKREAGHGEEIERK